MTTMRWAELKFVSERLADFYQETLTEPLPRRWVDLIHALNERERTTENGKAQKGRNGGRSG